MSLGFAGSAFNIAMAVGGVIGLGQLFSTFVPKNDIGKTGVIVAVGQTADTATIDPDALGGNIPAINIYAIDGRKVGSYAGDAGKTWAPGSSNPVNIENGENVQNVQSEYISVIATGQNAICISAIGLKNPNSDQSFGWFGDIGVTCGMPWHWSETIVGSTSDTSAYRSSCVWISGYYGKGEQNSIQTTGFSMHIIDFSQISKARSADYNSNLDLMCNSPARFSAYHTIVPELDPPFFIPALDYNQTDGTDLDHKAVLSPGLDKNDPNTVGLDFEVVRLERMRYTKPAPPPTPPAPVAAPPPVYTPPRPGAGNFGGVLGSVPKVGVGNFGGVLGEIPKNEAAAEPTPTSSPSSAPAISEEIKKRSYNDHHFRRSVIHSNHSEHSAKQLCESESSRGPDAISELEQLFCDMEHKKLYPLCSETVAVGCYDTEVNDLRLSLSKRFEGARVKNHRNVMKWGFDN